MFEWFQLLRSRQRLDALIVRAHVLKDGLVSAWTCPLLYGKEAGKAQFSI